MSRLCQALSRGKGSRWLPGASSRPVPLRGLQSLYQCLLLVALMCPGIQGPDCPPHLTPRASSLVTKPNSTSSSMSSLYCAPVSNTFLSSLGQELSSQCLQQISFPDAPHTLNCNYSLPSPWDIRHPKRPLGRVCPGWLGPLLPPGIQQTCFHPFQSLPSTWHALGPGLEAVIKASSEARVGSRWPGRKQGGGRRGQD